MSRAARLFAVPGALLVSLALSAAPALGTEAFRATFKLNAQSVVVELPADGPPILHITFVGHGHASGLGRVDVVTQVAELAVDGCRPSTVVHTLTGATGSLEITSEDEVCPHPSGKLPGSKIVGNWTISGGSGDFAGMTGTGHSDGVLGGGGNAVARLVGQIGE